MTIIICLVGTHYRRPFDGIRYWSKIHGITQLYLLYSDSKAETDTNVFAYMSKQNAIELGEKLEILDPIMVGYNPMDQRSAFKTIWRIMQGARASPDRSWRSGWTGVTRPRRRCWRRSCSPSRRSYPPSPN